MARGSRGGFCAQVPTIISSWFPSVVGFEPSTGYATGALAGCTIGASIRPSAGELVGGAAWTTQRGACSNHG
ncbi:hypothetical protein HN873_058868 [Arachis hypogaea]